MDHDFCNLEPPGYPWIATLPHRTMNFFSNFYSAGSNQCPKIEHFSSLENGYLTINCRSEVLIVEKPDFISMRSNMFVLTETGMEQ